MPISATPAILIVAPPTLQRQGLVATLRDARPDIDLKATADLPTLPDCLRTDEPTLVILDAALTNDALDFLIERIRDVCPDQRMLVLGGRRLPFHISRLIVEMGGGMLLASRATPADLLGAVARLLGESEPEPMNTFPDAKGIYAARHPAKQPASGLSNRELQVLRLIAADYSSKEIASHLSISVRTVETHRRLLLEKMGARTIVGVVLEAVRHGWLQIV